ncbi:MAG: bifunctional demethylmenaquinone methyltransferase/2-methoxy-6-polyprenyl-1,4-benzoquinol methylase UbiE [Candidatus Rickettsia vulgarisii]
MPNNNPEKINFGFEKVDFDQKKGLVKEVFSNVANKYDVMNDLMSLGIHRLWKDHFTKQIPNLSSNILDVASGSGDVAFRIMERGRGRNIIPNITLCDINQEMLEVARNKAIDNNILTGFNYIIADAENLPFEDSSFDYYTIAFGIRNISDINKVLKEAYRVLKPMGKFLCLEFSKVENDLLKKLYDFYSFNIIPKIGKAVADNESAYQYLVESIKLFPDQDNFLIMLKDAGFNKASYENLTNGVVAIHSGYKL